MGREKAVFTWFILSCFGLSAYPTTIDSLNNESLVALNKGLTAEALSLAEEARELAITTGDKKGGVLASFRLANAFQHADNFEAAQPLYENVIQQAHIMLDTHLLAKALDHFGLMLTMKEQFADGERSMMHAIRLFEQLRDTYELAFCNSHLATSYYARGDLSAAIKFFRKSELLATAFNINSVRGACYQNIGECFSELAQFDSAIVYTRQAIRMGIEQRDQHYLNHRFKNLLYIYDTIGSPLEGLRVNKSLFDTLAGHRMALDTGLLEPQSYLFGRYINAFETSQRKVWLREIVIIILSCILFVMIFLALKKSRRKNKSQIDVISPLVKESVAPSRVESLAARVAPLMEIDPQLAYCYTLLAADIPIVRISELLECSRRRVYELMDSIANQFGLNSRDAVKVDALRYGGADQQISTQ